MNIVSSNALTDEQTRQILALQRVCIEKDGLENHLFLTNEINYNRDIPTFYMAYDGDTLIGFLTFFIPTDREAEISAVVHPLYRRRQVFTRLDEAAREVIEQNRIGRTLYSVETKCPDAAQVLKRWRISEILRSEYRMRIDLTSFQQNKHSPDGDAALSVRRLTYENADAYASISGKAFDDGEERGHGNALITSDTRIGYVLYHKEEPVGVFAVGLESKDEPFLYGVAVAADKRGLGYGRRLMEQALRVACAYGNTLQLDVDSQNPIAFGLYRRMGFEVTFQVDYYVRPKAGRGLPSDSQG